MNTTVKNESVINEINSLIGVVPFGIKNRGTFIELKNISINQNGNLSYLNNNCEQRTVSSLIRDIKDLPTARWLNHLYFIDGYGNERSFKKYVSEKYNLKFT